jgi:hypothetical protein
MRRRCASYGADNDHSAVDCPIQVTIFAPERPMSENYLQRSHAISPRAAAWLAQLPRGVQLNALVQNYPRIINRLAELWELPRHCKDYLDDLIFDTRDGSRQGFQPEVAFEIAHLKALITDIIERKNQSRNPMYVNIWEHRLK